MRSPRPEPVVQNETVRLRPASPDPFGEALREHESRVYSIALRITGIRSKKLTAWSQVQSSLP